MDAWERIAACIGFDWDEGNALKNWEKHRVSIAECEQVFFNRPLVAAPDEEHSASEPRYYVLVQTDGGREIFLVCAVRADLIRVISARDMNRKERRSYRSHEETEDPEASL